MEDHNQVKTNSILHIIIYTMMLLLLASCSQVDADVKKIPTNFKSYSNKGLKFFYPEEYSLDSDAPAPVFGADRQVTFETFDNNALIGIDFYKASTSNYQKLTDWYVKVNSLKTSDDISGFKIEEVNIHGYEGNKIVWTDNFLDINLKNEVTILQIRTKPYPIIFTLNLSDNQIEEQSKHIKKILEGISIDSEGELL